MANCFAKPTVGAVAFLSLFFGKATVYLQYAFTYGILLKFSLFYLFRALYVYMGRLLLQEKVTFEII